MSAYSHYPMKKNHGIDLQCSPSDISKSADNIVVDFVSLLSGLPSDESCFSNCPWCGFECFHAHVLSGLFGKDLFKCRGCEQLTSKCLNHAECHNFTKGSLVWDQKHCVRCDKATDQLTNAVLGIHDFLHDLPCGILFGSHEKQENSPKWSSSTRRVSLIYHLDQSTQSSGSSISRRLSSIGLESISRRLSSIGLEICIEQSHFGSGGEPSSPTSPSLLDDAATGGEHPEAPMEPCMVARDAVLCWPGPEQHDVARFAAICAHGAFARRWLTAAGGDTARAVRMILAHLRWRREYGVDTILDEARLLSISNQQIRAQSPNINQL
jgi:hypothetical protein